MAKAEIEVDLNLTLLERVKKSRENFKHILNAQTSTLNELAEVMSNVKQLRKYLDDVIDELKAHQKDLVLKALELMDNQDIDTYTTKDGVKISRVFQVRGKVENSVEFFKWLSGRDDESLGKLQLAPSIIPDNIKEIIENADPENVNLAIHWKKLAAYINDVCDPLDSKTWPDGVTVEAWPDIKLNLK